MFSLEAVRGGRARSYQGLSVTWNIPLKIFDHVSRLDSDDDSALHTTKDLLASSLIVRVKDEFCRCL